MNASSGGTIDLSGLTTITRNGTPEDDVLVFQASGGGTIKLNSLQSINQDNFGDHGYTQTRFNFAASNLSLPSLISTRYTDFNIPAGGSIYVPVLQTFKDHSTLELSANTTFNAPALVDIGGTSGSAHRLNHHPQAAGILLHRPQSHQRLGRHDHHRWHFHLLRPQPLQHLPGCPHNSRGRKRYPRQPLAGGWQHNLYVSGGVVFQQDHRHLRQHRHWHLPPNSPPMRQRHADRCPYHQNHHLRLNGNATYTYTMNASSGGTVDLSGLTTITRNGTPENDILNFQCSGGGTIKFNALQSINQDNLRRLRVSPKPASISKQTRPHLSTPPHSPPATPTSTSPPRSI